MRAVNSTGLGYTRAMSKADELAGKICVVTGANTGIGRATAEALAGRGARLVLACRSEDKTRPVIDEIARHTGDDTRAQFLALDLSDLDQVRRAASELCDRVPKIDVLINNAGIGGQRGFTRQGFELHFGVNHLGHFLFTTLLLDKLRSSAPSRVVTVSSASHYSAKQGIDYAAVRQPTRSFTGMPEYGVSKLANVLFTSELSRRLEGTGVTTYAVHPGVIASDIWKRVPGLVRPIVKAFMKSNEEGARTSLYCATDPEVAGESGQYYAECKTTKPSHVARDPKAAAELWQKSEEMVGEARKPRARQGASEERAERT